MFLDPEFLIAWGRASIRLSSPIALAAVGGVYSERSGVFNIGIEGMMLLGAFFGIVGSHFLGNPYLGALAGAAAGALSALLLAYLTVTRHADQIMTGVAINLGALGLTNYLYRYIFEGGGRFRVPGFETIPIPVLGQIPGVGPLVFQQNAIVYFTYVMPIVAWWVMFRTTWGLNIRAAGEYPAAVDTAGVSVSFVRYASVLFSGVMAGVAGAGLALGGGRIFTQGMTAGRGFVALAAIVFGRWHPRLAALAALLFGAADALQLRVQTLDVGIPSELFAALPYVLTVIVLALTVRRSREPAQLGVPYRSQ